MVGGGGGGGATWCKTQSQAQYIAMIKCIEDSEVTMHSHFAHPFIMARISIYFCKLFQKALAELLSVITNILIYF